MVHQKPFIQIRGLGKYYVENRTNKITVLKDFNLDINDNELLVIIGPSGCGKTTLLKIIDGMISPDHGRVLVMGVPLSKGNPFAITIFQDYSLFPWRTALGNVQLPLESHAWRIADTQKRRELAEQALAKVGLEDRLHSYPKALSGGMQQRVALARSLVVNPPILLMDEPFGALDAQTRADMQRMLISLWLELKNLIVFVTHDIEEALILADRVIVLSERPATILGEFQIDYPRPRTSDFLLRDETMNLRKTILNLLYKH